MKHFLRFISTPRWWNPFFWVTGLIIIFSMCILAGVIGMIEGGREMTGIWKLYWKSRGKQIYDFKKGEWK